ncbi:MAG: TraR/DksA family transcriptional regulator [Solirubrobacteraceae bacterium]
MSGAADNGNLDVVRRLLEERRDATRQRVEALAQPPELGASQGFGKRIGDGTVEAISRLTEIGVGSSLEDGLARTERALAKLDEGTYGSCDVCGLHIPAARLEAMPDGVLCLACAGSQPGARPPQRR